MKVVCYREGRAGIHIGDVYYIPDDCSAYDVIHFAPAPDDNEADEAAKQAEIAKLEAQVAQAASAEVTPAEVPEADAPAENKD
jgi:hypothetical protein